MHLIRWGDSAKRVETWGFKGEATYQKNSLSPTVENGEESKNHSLINEYNDGRNVFRCDPDLGSDRLYYLALRAVDRYCDQWGADPGYTWEIDLKKFIYHGMHAGLTESDIEVDIGRLKTIAALMLSGLGLNNNPQVPINKLKISKLMTTSGPRWAHPWGHSLWWSLSTFCGCLSRRERCSGGH